MIIYNVTSKVDHRQHAPWLSWMERAYLPAVMESGTVERYHLTRLLGVDESDGPTYALLLTFKSRLVFDIYQEKHALNHQKAIKDKWGDAVLSFPSMLDVVLQGE
ncbi:DUF4286 family protein [Neolewinella persica]|uniref:DUF4286 family protein n=1 Tax=Neolewinella persica TaxID=70998 RepID=UPI00037B3979|nr:DUF4286 family protein [Neolewinella persica]